MSILNFKIRTPTIYLVGILSILLAGVLFSTHSSSVLSETKDYDEAKQPIASSELYFAIFEDYYPWGYSSIEDILDYNGIMYDIFDSSYIGSVNLFNYDKVIISSTSDSPETMNEMVIANRYWFEEYVQAGGFLELHACTNNYWNGFLPGGYEYVGSSSNEINIVTLEHPIFQYPWSISDEELDNWGSSVHGYLENTTGSTVLLDSINGPVLVEQILGNGIVLASTQTLEFGYGNGFSNFLENVLLYMGGGIGEFHDVSVNIIPPDFAYLGYAYPITVEVHNWGSLIEEDINVSLYLDGVSVLSDNIPTLNAYFMDSFVYEWIPMDLGNFTFIAIISNMTNETTYANNQFSQVIQVTELGENYYMEEIAYSWYDAYYNGYNIWMNGDDTYYELNLPFIFDFYDESFDTVYISSNGWMSFTDTSPTTYSNPSFPIMDYEYAIAVFWDDLIAQDNVYIWETDEFVVIEFHDYNHLSSELAGTFEVILFATGEILFQYQYMYSDSGATVGLNYGLEETLYNEYLPFLGGVMEFALQFSRDLMIEGHDLRMYMDASPGMGLNMTHLVDFNVRNFGSYNETDVAVELYMNEILIFTDLIPFLETGEYINYAYEWIPYAFGTYNFTALVQPVENETRIFNNQVSQSVHLVNNFIAMELGDMMMLRTSFDESNSYAKIEVVDILSPTEYVINLISIDGFSGEEYLDELIINPYTRECSGNFENFFPYWINVDDLYIGKLLQISDETFDGEITGFGNYSYNGFSRSSIIVQYVLEMNLIYDLTTGILVGLESPESVGFELIYTNIFDDIPIHHNIYGKFSIVNEDEDTDMVSVTALIMNTGTYVESTDTYILIDGCDVYHEYILDLNPGEYHLITMDVGSPDVPTSGDVLFTLTIDEVPGETYIQDNIDDHWVYMGEPVHGTLQIFVYDPSGSIPLADVEIHLEGSNLVFSLTIFTDDNGEVNFMEVPFGEYVVTLSMDGYVD
ncbi:MAG: CARDB domain-containing protein, partial [Promethearchaeota archaeon]